MPRVEHDPGDRVIWQSDRAKSYRCPVCHGWARSQYEGDDLPTTIRCHVRMVQNVIANGIRTPVLHTGHTLEWD